MNYRDDNFFMGQALQEAYAAMDEGEVPVGAVIVKEGKIIARGHNRVESTKDPTAHAEILTIGSACASLDGWRLEGCTLYVTLEPCPMCTGAVLNSRISKVVYGTQDKRLGACGSTCNLLEQGLLNRTTELVGGVRQEECADILKSFFQNLRSRKKEM
jgi:tRNA(adenine34) deaminase